MRRIRWQRGFTLLEMMLVFALASIWAVGTLNAKRLEEDQAQARRVGSHLYQYSQSLRKYLSNEGTGIAVGTHTYSGIDWLKAESYMDGGGATVQYLSQYVPNEVRFGGLRWETEIVKAGTSFTTRVLLHTVLMDKDGAPGTGFVVNGRSRGDLAGLAALAASGVDFMGGMDSSHGALTDAAIVYCIPGIAYDPTHMCSGSVNGVSASGAVIMEIASASFDIWLRTDGSNTMNSDIVFQTAAGFNPAIKGLSAINDFESGLLTIGSAADSNLVMMADQVQAMAATSVGISAPDITLTGQTTLAGNVEARGNMVFTTPNATLAVDNVVAGSGQFNLISSNGTTGRVADAYLGSVEASFVDADRIYSPDAEFDDVTINDSMTLANDLDVGRDATVGRDLDVGRDVLVSGDVDAFRVYADEVIDASGGTVWTGGTQYQRKIDWDGISAINRLHAWTLEAGAVNVDRLSSASGSGIEVLENMYVGGGSATSASLADRLNLHDGLIWNMGLTVTDRDLEFPTNVCPNGPGTRDAFAIPVVALPETYSVFPYLQNNSSNVLQIRLYRHNGSDWVRDTTSLPQSVVYVMKCR